jgi:iron complex transport system substrate-binding protein
MRHRLATRARSLWLVLLAAAISGGVFPAHAAAPAHRIVSLAPNLTELAYSAGAGDRMVGADAYSDYPAAARELPRVGDAFQVDYERVVALHPDLVLVWDTGTPEPVIAKLRQLGLHVERIGTSRLEDIASAIRRIGALAGTETRARQGAAEFTTAISELRRKHAHDAPVTVFFQIQAAPLFTINGEHLISDILQVCGGRNIFADLNQLAPPVSVEAVLERNPQVIIAGSDSAKEEDPLAQWRRWPQLAAVKSDTLYFVSADRIARATARVVEGTEQVCGLLAEARQRLSGAPVQP